MTDMNKQTMKLALDALEMIDRDDNDRDFLFPNQCYQLDEAITAMTKAGQRNLAGGGDSLGRAWHSGCPGGLAGLCRVDRGVASPDDGAMPQADREAHLGHSARQAAPTRCGNNATVRVCSNACDCVKLW